MKKGVERLYGAFTATERFRLLVEAMSRNDRVEAGRLRATCPQNLYRANQAAFCDRMQASEEIVVALALELHRWLAWIDLLQVMRRSRGAAAMPPLPGRDEAALDAAGTPLEDLLREQAITSAKNVWTGFAQFARDRLGMEPEVVVRAHLPPPRGPAGSA